MDKKLTGVFKTISENGLICVDKRELAPYVNKEGVQKQGGVTVVLQFLDFTGPQIELYAARGTDAFNIADSIQLMHKYHCGFKLNGFGSLEICDYIEIK